MKKKLSTILGSILIILTVIIAACNNTDKAKESSVKFNIHDSPKTIDPQLTTSATGLQIGAISMEGLLRLGKQAGEIYAAGAEKWNVSEDGKVWTFQLRKNAKWSNGEPITSADYIFGFKRALSPDTGAPYSYMLYCIKNAEEYSKGNIKDFSKVGVKGLNDYTLQFTLKNPIPYFDQLLTFAITYPTNEKFYNKVKDNYALNKESLLFNGPYMITKWVPAGEVVFKKNPKYWNSQNIEIENIVCPMITDYNTAANMYKSKELDILDITGDQLPMFKNTKNIHRIADSIWFLQFNTTNKYLKNEKIRRAIALSINREIFCNDIRKDGSLPAYSFVIPDITGGKVDDKPISFRERYDNSYFEENIELAKKLYAEGLKELGIEKLPKLKLLTSNNDSSRRDGQYVQEEIYKNLGLDIQLDPNTFQSRIQKTSQKDYDIVYRNWLPDFNDPVNFLGIWTSTSTNGYTGWENSEYDKLIKTANQTVDNDIRMNKFYKAEEILMREMPIAPLFFRTNNWLVRPNIKDLVIRGFGVQVSFIWTKLDK